MPDPGKLSEDRVPHTSPVLEPLYPPPPWPLPGAAVLKLVFETDKDPVLAWLPPKLTRSSPPYALLTVEHYPNSPVGPFSLANQYIGCRAGFFIRAFALQSVVDNPAALAALREVWGIPCRLGEVILEVEGSTAQARVAAGGLTLAEVEFTGGEDVDTGLVRFDPMLGLKLAPSVQESVRHDLIQLVQLDPDYQVKTALRGRASVTYGDGSPGSWGVLPNRNLISAVVCRVDTELPLARFVIPY